MRIAFFAKSKRRTRTTRYIAKALVRAGHEVLPVNERRRRGVLGPALSREWTLRSVRRFRPDVVLIHANDISAELLDALAPACRTVMFTPDCWPSPLRRRSLVLARRVDLLLTVAEGQIPEFLEAGVRGAAYLAEACEPSVHFPVLEVGPAWRSDVAFIGKAKVAAARESPRSRLVDEVRKRFDTKIYGRGWDRLGISTQRRDIYPRHYRKVCCGAKVVIGRDWRVDCSWYFSNRTWFTLGCGGFLVTNYVPRLEEIFENHRHLVWYRSEGECLELIEHYLARPDERRQIAEAGRAYALAHRTYDHFARDLADLLEGRPPAFPLPRG